MKSVIGAKVHEAETADAVCTLECDHAHGNLAWHETALYRTKRGQFFLAGRGDARSVWRGQTGRSSWAPGGQIRAVESDEARTHIEAADGSIDLFARVGLSVDEA
jgi:hypothetical protein